jgi:hypothetical protein
MTKKKIAESIIIRVGAGIREIPREPVEIAETPASLVLNRRKMCARSEPNWKQTQKLVQVKL